MKPAISEELLYLIWEKRRFQNYGLRAIEGHRIEVIHPGRRNIHSGPDFLNARVTIDGIDWAGNVEIHVRASDWYVHGHQSDSAFDNVVLHVVWEHDREIYNRNGEVIPTIELAGIVNEDVPRKISDLLNSLHFIPCCNDAKSLSRLAKTAEVERSALDRMELKAKEILREFEKIKDWREVTYRWIARCYGFKTNSEPFLMLSQNVQFKYLLKHRDNLFQIEAMLFGASGLVNVGEDDAYKEKLKKEYGFLKSKFGINVDVMNSSNWKFMRLRPPNFPTIRLAQFCSLIFHYPDVHSRLIEEKNLESLVQLFRSKQSEYWRAHYVFGKKVSEVNELGKSTAQNLVMNVVVPLLLAHGIDKDNQRLKERAVSILQTLPSENNRITRAYTALGFPLSNAIDSQGILQLHKSKCMLHRCLSCQVGQEIFNETQKHRVLEESSILYCKV